MSSNRDDFRPIVDAVLVIVLTVVLLSALGSLSGPRSPALALRPSLSGPRSPALALRPSLSGPRSLALALWPSLPGPRFPALALRSPLPGPWARSWTANTSLSWLRDPKAYPEHLGTPTHHTGQSGEIQDLALQSTSSASGRPIRVTRMIGTTRATRTTLNRGRC